jgi:hypothetical protein
LVKYLYFLKEEFDNKIFKNINVEYNNEIDKNVKEEFDDKINKKEILQITYKEYLLNMKKIRYVVIFNYRQLPQYIYDLRLNKIVDVRKCIVVYQINNENLIFCFFHT